MIGFSFEYAQVVKAIRDAILADAAITTYCNDTFGKNARIGMGSDSRDEWGEDQAPFIIVYPSQVAEGVAEQQPKIYYDIEIGVVVDKDAADYLTDPDDVGAEEMNGFYVCDGLKALIIDVLRQFADDYQVLPSYITTSYDSSTFVPLHTATISVECELDALINGTINFT